MTYLTLIDARQDTWSLKLYLGRSEIAKAVCPPTTEEHLLENLNGWVVEHMEGEMK